MTSSTKTTPRVTVLMPVYNAGEHLREAIESILGQTYREFEFLIIDDGSTDRSAELIGSFRDPRIRLVRNETNLGLIATLNRGLALAAGAFICRMDQDDISLPERLARQMDFLESHPEVAVCGTWFRKFGTGGGKTVRWQTDPDGVRCGLLFDSMLGHPTVMLRREFLREHGLQYDAAYKNAEDFALWVRVAEHGELANLGEVLLQYRVHPAQITQSASAGQRETAGKIRLGQLKKLGIDPTPAEFAIHQAVSTCVCAGVDDLFARAEQWLCKLKEANDRTGAFPEPAFSRALVERWLTFAKKAAEQGHRSIRAVYFPKLLARTGLGYGFVARHLARQLRSR